MSHQTIQALPNAIVQIAETDQLGAFSQASSQYLATRASHPVLGGCLITIGGMLTATFFGLLRYGMLSVWVGILLFVGALLIGGFGFGLYGSQSSVSAAYLFANGIIYSQRRKHTSLPWSEITSCDI